MSSTPMPEVPAPTGLTEMERLTNVFFEPSKTMADLRRRASWWVPWLIMSIFSYGLIVAWQQKIGFEKLSENQIHFNPKAEAAFEKAPPEQQQKQMSITVTITKFISYAYPAVLLLSLVIVAAILMAIFNFGFGMKTTFSSSMAITAYSFLPGILNTILAVITVFLSDPDGYDMRRPVASNLGAFMNPVDHPAIWVILSAFDIFGLWYIFLMATGFSVHSGGKVKRGSAFAAIFGVYFLFKLIGAGFAAM